MVPLIPDGATIQLGIGGLSSAIGSKLTDKNDLGIFSEMLCPSMVKLMKNGNVTNKYKGFMDGKSVYAFAAGDKAMYDFMIIMRISTMLIFSFANDPRMIMKNKKMISINTAMAINLYGEQLLTPSVIINTAQSAVSLIMFAVPNGPKAANPLSQWIPVT